MKNKYKYMWLAFAMITSTLWAQPGGIWSPIANMGPGGTPNRAFAVSFELNGLGYVGTGSNGGPGVGTNLLADFYSYNPSTGTWTQIANYGGGPIAAAVAFTAPSNTGGMAGYVGTGVVPATGNATTGTNKFYRYNVSGNTWTSRANLPISVSSAYGFALTSGLGQFGYLGGGKTGGWSQGSGTYQTSVYRYDHVNNIWNGAGTANIGNLVRAASFSISTPGANATNPQRGYVLGGSYLSGSTETAVSTLWEFRGPDAGNSNVNLTYISYYPGGTLNSMSAFGLTENIGGGNVARYAIGCGGQLGGGPGDVYMYNFQTNAWCSVASYPNKRFGATAFTAGGSAYVGTGTNDPQYFVGTRDFSKFAPQPRIIPLTTLAGTICGSNTTSITIQTDCSFNPVVGTTPANSFIVDLSYSSTFANSTVIGAVTSNAAGSVNIPITYPSAAGGTVYYRVRSSNPLTTVIGTGSATILPQHTAIPTGPSLVACNSQQISYTVATLPGLSYTWSLPQGGSITATNGNQVLVNWTGPGVYGLSVTGSNGCASTTTGIAITVSGSVLPTITGPAAMCTNATAVYTAGLQSNTTYQWLTTGGLSISNVNLNIVTVSGTAAGTLQLRTINQCGTTTSAVFAVSMGAPTLSLSGPTQVCTGTPLTFYTNAPCMGTNIFKSWGTNNSSTYSVNPIANGTCPGYISGNSFSFGNNSSATLTPATTGSFVVTVTTIDIGTSVSNPCPALLSVQVSNPVIAPTITGANNVCNGMNIYQTTTVAGALYSWQVSGGGTISNSNSSLATVNWTSPGIYRLSVTGMNSCDSKQTAITVTVGGVPSTPTISGSALVCPYGSYGYSITTTTGNVYTWSISGGALTPSTGSIVSMTPSGGGNATLVVKASNTCGTVTSGLYVVTVLAPVTISSITGPATICKNTLQKYTVGSLSGVGYTWLLQGNATYTASGVSLSLTGTGGLVNISVTGSGCASNTRSMVINVDSRSCCREYYSNVVTIPSLLGAGSAMPTLNGLGGTIVLDGNYRVIGDLQVVNGSVWVTPGSGLFFDPYKKLDILNTGNVTLTSATMTATCDTMWTGVYIYDNAGFTAIKTTGDSSEISHMLNGIQAYDGTSVLRLNKAKLLNNGDYSIYLDGRQIYTTWIYNGLSYIKNSRFDSDSSKTLVPYKHKVTNAHIRYQWLNYLAVKIANNRFQKALQGMVYYGPGHLSLGVYRVDSNYFDCYDNSIVIAQKLYSYNNTYMISGRRASIPGQYSDSLHNNGINLFRSCQTLISVNDRFISDYLPASKLRPAVTEGIFMKYMGDTVWIKNARFEKLDRGIMIAKEAPGANGSVITVTGRPMEITGNSFVNCVDGIRKNDYMYNTTEPGFPGGKASYNTKPLNIQCNGFQNGTRGIALFGDTSKLDLASVPAAGNKFTGMVNPIYSENIYAPLTWTYNRTTDEGITTPDGPGASSVSIINSGYTVFQVCGTSSPGAKIKASETEISEIKVYPNPFRDNFIIEFPSVTDQEYHLDLMDILGNSYYKKSGVATSAHTQLEIKPHMVTGIYFVKLKIADNLRVIKVSKLD